jgi:hypothetical protein
MSQLKVIASSLNVRKTPSLQGAIIGSMSEGDIVELLETSDDQKWHRIQKGGLTGWSSQKFLVPVGGGGGAGGGGGGNTPSDSLGEIIQIAATSAIATFDWPGRGLAPRGFIKGMALTFGRVYCKLKAGSPFAIEMAKANTSNGSKDAIAHYANKFAELGMDNDASGEETLRHLFVLMLGLGMRESSGRFCEGRDRAAENTSSNTAEAGMFQTSWDARTSSPLLPLLFDEYSAHPAGFVDVFKEGVTPKPKDLENFGSGNGKEFQRLSKECPAFAAEFAAIGLRNLRTHWGPINTRAAVVRPEADRMLLRVQNAVDASGLCPALG